MPISASTRPVCQLVPCLILGLAGLVASASEKDQELYQLGTTLYSRGDWESAAKRFRQVLENGSDQRLILLSRFYLAETLVAQKEYRPAKDYLQQFLQDAPDHPFSTQATFRLGEVCYLLGEEEPAFTYLKKFADEHPSHPLLEYGLPYLAEMQLKKGNLVSAARLFQESLRLNPNGVLAHEARFGLARSLEKTGSLQEAMRFYQFLVDHPESNRAADSLLQLGKIHFREERLELAENLFRKFNREYPDSELANPVRYWQGRICHARQRHDQAVLFFEAALKHQPRPAMIPALKYELARNLVEQERLSDAMIHLESVVSEFPQTDWGDDSLLLNIQVLRNSQQYDEAAKLCQQFYRMFPNSELGIHVMESQAESLYATDQFELASSLFKRMIRKTKDRGEDDQLASRLQAWKYKLAVSQIKSGKKQEASTTLQSIDLEKCDAEIKSASILAAATIQIDRNQLAQATRNLIEFVEANPNDPCTKKCVIDVTLLFGKRGNLQAADQWLQKIMDARLKTETGMQLAEIAFDKGQYRFANRWYAETARRASKKSTHARALMGSIWSLKELGNVESLLASATRLVETYPDSPEAPRALYLKTVLLEKSGNLDAAIEGYEKLLAQYTECPNFESALISLCDHYRQQIPDRIVELVPRLSRLLATGNSSHEDQLLYELAWLLQETGQKERSIRCFEKITLEHADSRYAAEAKLQVATFQLAAGKLEDAKRLYRELLQGTEKRSGPVGEKIESTARFHLAKIALDQGEPLEAYRELKLLLDRLPATDLADAARYWIAETRFRLGEYETAAKLFESARILNGISSPHAGRTLLRLAQTHIRLEQWEKASTVAEQLLLSSPGDKSTCLFEAQYVVGRAHFGRGRFSTARNAFEKVVSDPLARGSETAAMSQWMTGETHFHQEHFEKAIDAYQKAEILHAFPEWQAASLLQTGKCFEHLQKKNQAIRSYERLIAKHGTSRYAEEGRTRLEELQKTAVSSRPTAPDSPKKQPVRKTR